MLARLATWLRHVWIKPAPRSLLPRGHVAGPRLPDPGLPYERYRPDRIERGGQITAPGSVAPKCQARVPTPPPAARCLQGGPVHGPRPYVFDPNQSLIIESRLKCPWCTDRRMIQEIGRDSAGDVRTWHECLHCGYRVREEA